MTTALRQSVIQRYNSWVIYRYKPRQSIDIQSYMLCTHKLIIRMYIFQIFYLPIAAFVPPTHFLVHTQFNLLYQFWIHTEVGLITCIRSFQYALQVQFILHFQFLVESHVHVALVCVSCRKLVHKLGPLEWILNTPSHHRVHHGRNRYCIDKNYAGVFIIWDRMFGNNINIYVGRLMLKGYCTTCTCMYLARF